MRRMLVGLLCLLLWCLCRTAPAGYAAISIRTRPNMASSSHAAESPSCLNNPAIGTKVWTVAISDTLAYLGDGQALTILDISDAARPICRSHLSLPQNIAVTAIQLRGAYVYLALNNSNDSDIALQIVDVHDPDHPTLMGSYNGANANDLAVDGNLVYVATFPDLKIVDVGNPNAPALAGSFTANSTGNLELVGKRLYLNMLSFQILDLADPIHPLRLGEYNQGSLGWVSFSVSGNRAYLLRSAGGVDVLDISSPNNPLLLGTYANIDFLDGHFHPFTQGFQVIGDRMYIADTQFQIYDVSSPTQAILIGRYDAPGAGYDMRIAGNLAYTANGERGLGTGDYGFEVIDLSRETNPFLRGWFHSGATGQFFYIPLTQR